MTEKTGTKLNAVRRVLELLRFEKKEISAIYFYAIFNGLIQLSLPLGIQSIINFIMGGALSTSLVILIILVVLGVFITGLLQVNQMKIIEKIQQQLFVRYAFQYAHTLPKLNLKGIDNYYLPELVNRFFDTVSLQKGLSRLLLDIPLATIQILFGLLLLSFYHPVFIFFGVVLIAIVYAIIILTGSRGLQTSIEESNFKYKVAGWLEEIGRVITSIKFTRNSSLHLHKTDERVAGYLDARTRHFRILLFQYWSLIAFKVIITASMLIVGSALLMNQQLNIGQFIAAEIVIITVMTSVEKLIGSLDKVYDVLTSLEKLSKLTEQPLEPVGNLHPAGNRDKGIAIHIEQLNFSYDGEQPSLRDISLKIAPGEKVCITGKLGSGKSTLLKVLTGSYQPYTGSITYDGLPLSSCNLAQLRAQTGTLLENQDIFEGTLLENITMGDPSIATTDILHLAGRVGLKPFLDLSEKGLYTELFPMGKRLPRRVIQKILLLRALVNTPRLLLLEDPWLGLEEAAVQQIQDLLIQDFPNTTILVVTQDEQFKSRCSRVLVFDQGQMQEA